MKKLLFLIPLLFCSVAYATPSSLSINKGLTEGSNGVVFTVSGSDFTTHADNNLTEAHLLWVYDNGEDFDTFKEADWSEVRPYLSNVANNLTYSSSLTASQSHSFSTNYITGCHFGTGDAYSANVLLYKRDTSAITKFFASWYYQEDNSYALGPYGTVGSFDLRNNKVFLLQDNNSPYGGSGSGSSYVYSDEDYLAEYTTGWAQIFVPETYAQRRLKLDGVGTVVSGSRYSSRINWTVGVWEKWEVQGEILPSGTTSYKCWVLTNSSKDKAVASGKKIEFTSTGFPFALYGIAVGGYRDEMKSWARRYFDDVVVDKTWSRVVIGNNSTYESCTIRETQIPTSWATDSITFKVNQGNLDYSQNNYLFVIDSDGNISDGLNISEASGGGGGVADTTPPTISTSPSDNAINVSLSSPIVFVASDGASGVDLNSLTLSNAVSVNNVNYASSVSASGTKDSVTCTLSNAVLGNFEPAETVTVGVNIKDLSENSVLTTWDFTTEDNTFRQNAETITLNGQTLELK